MWIKLRNTIQDYFSKDSNFLFWLLVVALGLRIACIYYYIPPVNQDELTILYDAISVVETGKDRWGSENHFIFRSLGIGDYRPPLYFWLQILFYKLFHIDEYGARCIAAIFGVIGILYTYKVSGILINKKFARIFSIVLVFAPIHIFFSSVGVESNILGSSILVVSFYYFLRYKESNKLTYSLLSFSFAVLSIYVYQSFKLSAFLILVAYSVSLILSKNYRHLIYSSLIATVVASSQIYVFITAPHQYIARASDTVVKAPHVLEFIYESIAILFKDFLHQDWFFNLDHCVHLFNIRFLAIQLPLYIIGFRFIKDNNLFRRKEYKCYFFVILFVSAIPQLLTNSSMNPLRNSFIIYFIACIISFGIYYLYSYRKVIFSLIFINFIIAVSYGYRQDSRGCGYQNDLVQFYQKLNFYDDKYDKVVIENFGNQQYVYLLYYCKLSPSYFQKSIKIIDSTGAFDRVKQIGKYIYIDRDTLNQKPNTLPQKSTLVITQNKYDIKPIDSFEQFYYYSL